jgi:hypothetical protein
VIVALHKCCFAASPYFRLLRLEDLFAGPTKFKVVHALFALRFSCRACGAGRYLQASFTESPDELHVRIPLNVNRPARIASVLSEMRLQQIVTAD